MGKDFDSFWELADLKERKRYNAAYRIISRDEGEEYVLGRLVKGLESSRLAARLGFSVALTGLVKKGGVGVGKKVQELLDKEYPSRINENPVGVAILLGFNALVESGVFADDEEFLLKLVKELFQILIKHRTLITAIVKCLVTAIKQDADLSDTFLVETNGKFLETERFGEISQMLSKSISTVSKPHPIWDTMIEDLQNTTLDTFKKFWSEAVEKRYMSAPDVPKLTNAGLTIAKMVLEKGFTPDKITVVLSEQLFDLINHLHRRMKFSVQPLKELLVTMTASVLQLKNSEFLLTILDSLNQVSFAFDSSTNCTFVHLMISGLPAGAPTEYYGKLKKKLEKQHKESEEKGILSQMQSIFRGAEKNAEEDTNFNLRKTILKDIFSHCLSSTSPENSACSRSILCSCLEGLCRVEIKGGNGKINLSQTNVTLLTQLLAEILESKNTSLESTELQSALNHALKLCKKMGKTEEGGVERGFQVLLLYLPLWTILFSDFRSTLLDSLEEVCKCGKLFRSGETGIPPWIDVLIEVMLSLMSLPNRYVRTAVQVAFHYFVPRIDTTHCDQILKVLSPKDEDSLGSVEDEEEEEEEGVEDDQETHQLQQEVSEGSEEEGSGSEEESEEDSVDQELALNVKKALGKAAEEDEGMASDFSDDTMLRLDDNLAAAFRSHLQERGKDKSVAKERCVFRMRCFDLCLVLLYSNPHPNILLHMIPGLLSVSNEAVKLSLERSGHSEYSKSTALLKHIQQMRKVNQEQLKSTSLSKCFEKILQVSSVIVNPELQIISGECCAYLISLASHMKTEKDEELWEEMTSALTSFMEKRECLTPSILFTEMFSRQPKYLLELLPTLGKYAFCDPEIRVFRKTEAVEWCRLLLHGLQCSSEENGLGKKSWKKLTKYLHSGLKQMMLDANDETEKDKLRPKLFAITILLLRDVVLRKMDRKLYSLDEEELKTELEKMEEKSFWKKGAMTAVGGILSKATKTTPHTVLRKILNGLKNTGEQNGQENVPQTTTGEENEEPVSKKTKHTQDI